MTDWEFKPLRPGETERVCVQCGVAFSPTSRTQKRCPDCREKRMRHVRPARRGGLSAEMLKARKKMEHNTMGLNDAMFRELERIEACNTPEDIEAEGIRADKVCNLAAGIIANGKLMIQAAQMSMGVAETVNVPRALLGNGDGK